MATSSATTVTPGDIVGLASSLFGAADARNMDNYAIAKKNSADCWYEPTCKTLETLIADIITKAGGSTAVEHSTANAKIFGRTLVESTFQEWRATQLPKIYGMQAAAGAYNSTSVQMLGNHAYNAVVIKGAELVVKTITDYAQVRTADINALASYTNATKGSITVSGASNTAAASGGSGDILGRGLTLGAKVLGIKP